MAATRHAQRQTIGAIGRQSKAGYGRTLDRLVLLPAVHVQDVCVRTSVAKKQFSCDLRVRNSTNQERKVSLATRCRRGPDAIGDTPPSAG